MSEQATLDGLFEQRDLLGVGAGMIQPDNSSVLDVVQPALGGNVSVVAVASPSERDARLRLTQHGENSYLQRAVWSDGRNLLEVVDPDVHALVDRNVTLRDGHDGEQWFCVIAGLPDLLAEALRVLINIGLIVRIEVRREVHLREEGKRKTSRGSN